MPNIASESSKQVRGDGGGTVIAVIFLMSLFFFSFGAYSAITRSELRTIGNYGASLKGLYAAEGGLNLRTIELKSILTRSRLTGTELGGLAPKTDGDSIPCVGGNLGSGDRKCEETLIGGRSVYSYVADSVRPASWEPIPVGERFSGLNSFVRKFSIFSVARNPQANSAEAILRLDLSVFSVPLFQFAAFFANDLEITNWQKMTINGPVYTNKNLYLTTKEGLTIEGNVVASNNIFMGEPDMDRCRPNAKGTVTVWDVSNTPRALPECSSPRYKLTDSDIAPWQGKIRMNSSPVELPSAELLEIGGDLWQAADLRLVLKLHSGGGNAGNPDWSINRKLAIEVQDVDGNRRQDATSLLEQCDGSVTSLFLRDPAGGGPTYDLSTGAPNPGLIFGNDATTTNRAVGVSNTFFDLREDKGPKDADYTNGPTFNSTLLELDVGALLACIQRGIDPDGDGTSGPNPVFLLDNFRGLDDDTENGLVVYATIEGPRSELSQSFYGVRVRNGKVLKSNWPGSPQIKGLSIVSSHMLYSVGDYNSPADAADWRPAAFMADAYTALSSEWCPASEWSAPGTWGPKKCDRRSVENNGFNLSLRNPVNDSVLNTQVAILAGHDDFDTLGRSTGGLQNFMRYMENWAPAKAFHSYTGSLVSLGVPKHSSGRFSEKGQGFSPFTEPNRDYHFDTRFTVRSNLPPATPEMSYASQRMFDRSFEQ